MAKDTDGGPDGASSAAPAFTPATTPFWSLEQDFYNHFNSNFHARRHGKMAGSQAGVGRQQATPQPADMTKSASSTAPSSTQAPAALPPNQANMFSLLCLIASSVLASAAKASAQTDDMALQPDPPEVVPEDLGSHNAAPAKQQAAVTDPAAPTETCKHCSCAIKPAAETAAQMGRASGAAKPAATSDSAATEKPTDDASIGNSKKPASDKSAPKTPSSEEQPSSDGQAAKTGTTAEDEAAADGAPTPEPQAPTDQATPSAEIDAPVAAEDGAAAGDEEDAAAESPEADSNQTTEEPAKPEPPKPETAATATTATTTTTLPPPPPPATTTNANPLKLPEWFLGNNVVLYEDLAKRQSALELFKPKPAKKTASEPEVEEAKSESTAESSAESTAQNTPGTTPTSTPPSELESESESKADKEAEKQSESTLKDTAEATPAVEPDVKSEDKAAAADKKDDQSIDSSAATTTPAESSSDPPKTEAAEEMCSCKKAAADLEKTQAASDKSAEVDKPSPQRPVYQLHQDIYDEALDLLSAALQPPVKSATDDSTAKKNPPESWITQSSFLIQSPKDGSLEFLDEVVRQVCRDVQADVVMMELDDLEDLCYQFWHESDEVRAVGPKYLTSPLRLVGEFFGYGKPDEKAKAAVSCILEGPASKRESLADASAKSSADKTAEAETRAAAAAAAIGEKAVAGAAGDSVDAADILQAGVKDAFEAATKILQAAIKEAFASIPKPDTAATTTSDSQQVAEAETSAAEAATKPSTADDKDASPAQPRPLVILFRNVEAVGKQTPMQRLVEGVNKVRRESGLPVVVVGTAVSNSSSENRPTTGISKAWDGLGLDDSTVINVSPRNTKRASAAMKQHGARARPRVKWRLLRRSIRVTLDQHPTVKFDALYPSGPAAGESVVDELEDEHRRQTLTDWDDTLSARVVRQVSARAVRAGAVTPADVFDVMERVMKNQAILNKMNEAGDDDFVGEDGDSDEEQVEFGGPAQKSKVKSLLASISDSCSDAEKEYFDCVVDTVAVSSAAQGIHMDQALMDSLKQLLSLRTSKPYGLLAKEAVNGAILYGPPGTGKTHLARVVAASSGTNLIVATPADIQNMWVGETEKRIKALFSLGTKLAPCVIFLDEGDSVFGRRQSRDRDWQRKAMSQFLMEMDGLVSRKKAPFLMVATNRPGDIDEAVCRRLPHTLHIGMPTAAGRRAILDIYLKDEKLDEKLDLDEVAADSMTKGFSGSDIRTLCVQAAMAAHKALEANNKAKAESGPGAAADGDAEDKTGTQKRVIKMEHFKTALERTRPSVTRESLMEIERFTGQQEESGDHRAMYI